MIPQSIVRKGMHVIWKGTIIKETELKKPLGVQGNCAVILQIIPYAFNSSFEEHWAGGIFFPHLIKILHFMEFLNKVTMDRFSRVTNRLKKSKTISTVVI